MIHLIGLLGKGRNEQMRQNLKWLLIGLFQKRDMETMIKRGRVLSKLLGQINSIGENRIWTNASFFLLIQGILAKKINHESF